MRPSSNLCGALAEDKGNLVEVADSPGPTDLVTMMGGPRSVNPPLGVELPRLSLLDSGPCREESSFFLRSGPEAAGTLAEPWMAAEVEQVSIWP